MAYERDVGRSADQRHHVRLWRIASDRWLAAATFDRGVGFSLFTLQITHHIGPEVDRDRNLVGAAIVAVGGRKLASVPSRVVPGRWQWRRRPLSNRRHDRYLSVRWQLPVTLVD